MSIEKYTYSDYTELLSIWESSVRSTHHFLTEKDILFYKSLVLKEFLPATNLYVIRNHENRITAFMGLSDELIEMLFVHPDEQGKGYGKQLVEYAIHNHHIRKVDVNEQNKKAFYFYMNQGFKIIARDQTDNMGKPFPILHLELNPIRLRSANIQDIPHLQTIFEQSILETCRKDYSQEQLHAWIARVDFQRWQELFKSDLHFFLAEETSRFSPVGFTSVNSKGYLHSMFVHPSYQHQGVAKLLLCQVEKFVQAYQAPFLYSEVSLTAHPFFEKQRFITESLQTVFVNKVEINNFIMKKKLE